MCSVSLNDLECLSPCQGVDGQSFRRAELELALLDSFNSLLSSQRSHPREDNIVDGSKCKIVPFMDWLR